MAGRQPAGGESGQRHGARTGARSAIPLGRGAGREPIDFAYEPDAAGRARMAEALGIPGIRKLRLAGRISPEGGRDWHLAAELGATAVQECVVTLEPVTTRIDEPVERVYVAEAPQPLPGETEMPEDDRIEPLPATLDLAALAEEALALALPAFPRAPGASLGAVEAVPPGAAPIDEAAAKPFAGLAALRGRLAGEGDDGDGGEG